MLLGLIRSTIKLLKAALVLGSIAIQLAKLHGCKVFTTVSSSKYDYVKQLAPDTIINYQTEDVDKKLADLTDGLGIDLIIDTVGKKEAELDLWRIAYNGRLVTIVDIPSLDNVPMFDRSEEHTSELQSRFDLVCRLLLEKKNININ